LIKELSDRVAPVNQEALDLSQQRRARRLARYEEVKHLKQQGLPIRQIAQQLGAHRRTIRNFLRAESFPERQTPKPRATLMDPFVEYLKKRWEEGCHNGSQLYREIRRQGYRGGAASVRRHIRKWRGIVPEVIRKLRLLPDFPPPSPRQMAWWFCLDEDRLEKQEKEYVGVLTRLNSEIQTVRELAGEFRQLVKQRQEARLDQWRERVARSGFSELKSFAEGLMNDEMAVREALRSKWSNGHTNIVALLLTRGVGINSTSRFDRTPLMWAANGGRNETVKFLIKHGSDLSIKDREEKTALMLAIEREHASTAAIIREYLERGDVKRIK